MRTCACIDGIPALLESHPPLAHYVSRFTHTSTNARKLRLFRLQHITEMLLSVSFVYIQIHLSCCRVVHIHSHLLFSIRIFGSRAGPDEFVAREMRAPSSGAHATRRYWVVRLTNCEMMIFAIIPSVPFLFGPLGDPCFGLIIYNSCTSGCYFVRKRMSRNFSTWCITFCRFSDLWMELRSHTHSLGMGDI